LAAENQELQPEAPAAAGIAGSDGSAVTPFWATGGNANTDPSAHFFGTLDNQPLVIKTNGAEVMRVTETGLVGIGTSNPGAALHIVRDENLSTELAIRETNPGQAAIIVLTNAVRSWVVGADASPDVFEISQCCSPAATRLAILGSNGNVGIGTTTPGHPLEMASGANVTAGGVWTNASSRAYKENIRDLTSAEARTALEGLTPVRYNYKTDADEGYVGFIAEDVPALVATQDRKGLSPMDVVAVLTKIVQEQNERIAELEARFDARQ
jgi:hypothetical protein